MKYYRIIIIALLTIFSGSLSAQQANAERLESIVTELASDSYMGRGFGTEYGVRAADYIIEQFKISGIEPLLDGYRHTFDYREGLLNIIGNNIVGIVRGSDPELADEYIIVGAHYDHLGWEVEDGDTLIYNGADDNASGDASVIELGKILSENREQLGRSVILIAFDGEESGLIGSKAFLREMIKGPDAVIDFESVVAMFSLDMLGMYSTHEGIDLDGVELLADYKQLIDKTIEFSPVDIVKTTGGIPNRTDTGPFGKAGIPAIHIFTGLESPYHEPEDDSDLLDYEGMAEVVNFIAAFIGELSNVPEVKKSKQIESVAKSGSIKYFNPGFTMNIGSSYFDYKKNYYKSKTVFAYAAGISLETRISQVFAIQPEVVYEWSGSQVEEGSLHTHAVTVPVSLLITTPDEGEDVRAYYQFGGYYSYAFGGSSNGAALDFATDYNDTDYGMVFGIGMEIMHFRVGYLFQQSLVDFSITDPLDTRLKGSFFKIGYVF